MSGPVPLFRVTFRRTISYSLRPWWRRLLRLGPTYHSKPQWVSLYLGGNHVLGLDYDEHTRAIFKAGVLAGAAGQVANLQVEVVRSATAYVKTGAGPVTIDIASVPEVYHIQTEEPPCGEPGPWRPGDAP